jgi:hypothetical protein
MKFAKSILPALVLATVLTAFSEPSFANCGNDNGRGKGCSMDAPGPLIGAGLPGLAIGIGYGAYWLTRRRRKIG